MYFQRLREYLEEFNVELDRDIMEVDLYDYFSQNQNRLSFTILD